MIIKIDKNKEVTSRLPFEPVPEFNNLAIGYLTDVEVVTTTSKEDAKWEFAGMEVPMLAFRFTAFKRNKTDADRFMTMSFMPISNQLADGTDREDSKLQTSYVQMWDKIKHLHDQYITNDNYKAIDADPTFDNTKSAEERIKEFEVFFTAIVNDFKLGKDKTTPIYKEKQDLAMVIVASGKKLSFHALPDFVGKGIFQLAKFKGGKLDTDLRIPINATIKLGIDATAATPVQGQAAVGIPAELAELGMG